MNTRTNSLRYILFFSALLAFFAYHLAKAQLMSTDPTLDVNSVLNTGVGKTEFSFAIMGDTQGFDFLQPNDALRKAVANIEEQQPHFVMTVGDLIPSCDEPLVCSVRFDQWKEMLGPLVFKTFTVMGNHDHSGKEFSNGVWQNEFVMPTNGPENLEELVYSFDYGNAHFVVLNSEIDGGHKIGKEQREWLQQDLAVNTKPHTFVFFHQPAFPMATKFDSSLDLHEKDRDDLWKILDEHKVTAVFNGHEHVVSTKRIDEKFFDKAKNDVWQINVGATEASMRDYDKDEGADYYYNKEKVYSLVIVSNGKVTLEIHKLDGKLVKSFEIK